MEQQEKRANIFKISLNFSKTALIFFTMTAFILACGTQPSVLYQAVCTGSNVNVRSLDDTYKYWDLPINNEKNKAAISKYRIIGQLNKGDLVSVNSLKGEWAEISKNPLQGWVSKQYLEKFYTTNTNDLYRESLEDSGFISLDDKNISNYTKDIIKNRAINFEYSPDYTAIIKSFDDHGNEMTNIFYIKNTNYSIDIKNKEFDNIRNKWGKDAVIRQYLAKNYSISGNGQYVGMASQDIQYVEFKERNRYRKLSPNDSLEFKAVNKIFYYDKNFKLLWEKDSPTDYFHISKISYDGNKIFVIFGTNQTRGYPNGGELNPGYVSVFNKEGKEISRFYWKWIFKDIETSKYGKFVKDGNYDLPTDDVHKDRFDQLTRIIDVENKTEKYYYFNFGKDSFPAVDFVGDYIRLKHKNREFYYQTLKDFPDNSDEFKDGKK